MNTDASDVEGINIPQIIERLSMSCIASFEDWSNIFRDRSFTLFKNDRDLRERFDSVAVSESLSSSSMTNLSSTGLTVLASNISSDFQPIWCHPHTQIRIIRFHGVRISILQLEPFSQPYFKMIFSALTITVLPKSDHTDFAQEERPGLPCWTMIKATLCRGRRFHKSGLFDSGILSYLGVSSIFTWVSKKHFCK